MAILLDLKLAAERSLKVEEVESDALLVVHEINKKEASLSEWFGILNDIHYYANKCEMVSFHHINSEANSFAHGVAKLYHVDGVVLCRDLTLPLSLFVLLKFDLLFVLLIID